MHYPKAIILSKRLIVFPGLFLLVPSLMTLGITGHRLADGRQSRFIIKKQQRMRLVMLNGLLILLPLALLLRSLAIHHSFTPWFYRLQALELLAGASNMMLIGMNIRDGIRLSKCQKPQRRLA